MSKLTYFSFVVLLCFCLLFSACRSQKEIMLSGFTMGTSYHITYLLPWNCNIDQNEVEDQIKKTLSIVNYQMSTYDKSSILSRLNQDQDNKPSEIPESLANVIKEAILLNRVTQGGLDITIGRLVNLWGFGAKYSRTIVPDDNTIKETMGYTGVDKICVTKSDGKYFFQKKSETYIDLASIAKGFGVDEVARLLESFSIENFLVEIGGEIQVKGRNKQGNLWRVGIEKPDTKGQRVAETVISLTDIGMATSGDYRNYFEQNGKRFSHAIDPSTGYPIEHNLASITVLHSSTMTADGLATGLYVLGPERALKIAEKENLAVYLILREKDGFYGVSSSAFAKILKK